ncbi:hypothetical protein B0T10DRAFT_271312 [Thelonectria olida]|uniref:Secreted protein n=1 Tax=Thelonectria olida TaxID=1576542 RepID=A0A9P8WBM9_9HYPO|nr:hypothetical protein B0T10DRAFT_271312 [Thelonectria olida]
MPSAHKAFILLLLPLPTHLWSSPCPCHDPCLASPQVNPLLPGANFLGPSLVLSHGVAQWCRRSSAATTKSTGPTTTTTLLVTG